MAECLAVGPVVLGYLHICGPIHGYELLSRMHQDLGRVWRVAPSQLYATLDRLERLGYIQSSREDQENRPPRIRYALTEQGKASFWQWVCSPVPRVRLLRFELLPKIFFLQKLAPERLPELLLGQKETLLTLAARVKAETPMDPFQEVVRGFRLAQLAAGLQWIEELLQKEAM